MSGVILPLRPPAPPDGGRLTADEFFAVELEGPCELIEGRVQAMAPSGQDHSGIAGDVAGRLWGAVRPSGRGRVYVAEGGFLIRRNPDTVRVPDVAFVSRDRIGPGPHPGFFEGAPDLAVEVVSPSDRPAAVAEKAREWLAAGARQVWVLNPARRSVSVYFADGRSETLDEQQTLTGGDLLPGFTVSVAELFAP